MDEEMISRSLPQLDGLMLLTRTGARASECPTRVPSRTTRGDKEAPFPAAEDPGSEG